MSAWARLLDWLSWKYNVVFVVSAGNHPRDIELRVSRTDLPGLNPKERERAVIKAVAADTRNRRLLSPAETLNGLTVGAAHADASPPGPYTRLIDPYLRPGAPSTISAHGPGYRRAIKPEILLAGGRQFLAEKLGTAHANAVLECVDLPRPPGQRTAAPGRSGELDRTWHTRGTSNAAALASRWAMYLFDVLEHLRATPGTTLPSDYDVVLLKTLLVHGAAWDDPGELYKSILGNGENNRGLRDYVGRFLGYGSADVARVLACTDERATVLGVGQLMADECDEFRLPLPPSLSATTVKRRLTVTLAWLSPIDSMCQKYRVAHLSFGTKSRLGGVRVCADHDATLRGTVQHEVLEGEQAVAFQDGDAVLVKVDCRADAGDVREPIRYGLAVTLEVAEGVSIPIYQEVRERLRVRVPVRGVGPT